MKIVIGLLAFIMLTPFLVAQEEEEGMKIAEEGEFFIADGDRIYLQKEDISIVPPSGWEVKTNVSGMTALFQMPKRPEDKIPRTIQIQSFSDPQYIDAVTAEKFAIDLEEKFSESSASISNYRLRSHIPVDMKDGSNGWLFYFGFSINGVELMHAHLLASSASRHYVITYTDIAENFVNENSNKEDFLDIAWKSMISMQLPSAAPERLGLARWMGFAFGALALMGLAWAFVRRKKAGKVYSQYADGKIPTGFGSTLHETHLKDDELEEVEVIIHTEYGEDDIANEALHFDDSAATIPESEHLGQSGAEKKIG